MLTSAATRCAMHMKNINKALWPSLSQPQIGHHRFISSSPLLMDDNSGGESSSSNNGDDKKEMIQRWMKWNTAKTWKYEPNHDLISKIGKEGSTSPLDAFRDTVSKEKRQTERVGRSWSAKELRRKSYDDLHKLWLVLYKEKNMLLTEANLARRHGYMMIQPDRRKKVRKSMGAIRHVLGERKRAKIADHKLYLEELERVGALLEDLDVAAGEGGSMEDDMHNEATEKLEEDKI